MNISKVNEYFKSRSLFQKTIIFQKLIYVLKVDKSFKRQKYNNVYVSKGRLTTEAHNIGCYIYYIKVGIYVELMINQILF